MLHLGNWSLGFWPLQPCRWCHWGSALDQVRFKIAVRFPWGLTFHHHGLIPGSIHRNVKRQQFYWIHNFEPQVADLGFIHLISGLDSQFFSFFLICTLHDSAPMHNINQTNQFLVWNWSRIHTHNVSFCPVCTFFGGTYTLASFSNVLQSLQGCLFSRPDRN